MRTAREAILPEELAAKLLARASPDATLRYASFIERLARSAAGKKVAARYGVHVADAIEPTAIPSREFRARKLAALEALMSGPRRDELASR